MCQQKEPEDFIVIAHRGASRAAPENTLSSMKKAIEFGADFAECDVFQTKDGEIVLFHDEEMERTTGKEGMIWDYTLAELKELEVGSWFKEEFRGEPIPTLQEVIQAVKGKIKLNIEVKVSGEDPEIAQKVVDIIRAENIGKECMVTSFEKPVLEKVKEIAPDLITGFIFDEEHPPDIFDGNWEYVCSKRNIVDEAFVQKAKQKGKKIFVWTVNYPAEMKKMIDLGVDGIITDVPDILKGILSSKERNN
ncbi:MAG: glycerophosphodiester phosphodiesterase [Candidatus Aminicenantes bacterium]|nr:MAG: glycerophosphodiester phosphodiesterase [Candidatus Aminicenantes bacterium]